MVKVSKLKKALAITLPVLLLFWSIPNALGAERNNTTVNIIDTISNQSEFDALIYKASHRKEVDAYLKEGTYIIEGSNPIYTKFKLRGEGAVLKQRNKILTKKDAIKETSTHYICPIDNIGIFSLFVDTEGNNVAVSEDSEPKSKVNYITEDVVPVYSQNSSEINKIKLKIPDNLNYLRNLSFSKAFGYIDSWWSAPTFAITHSDEDYFYCDLLQPRTKEQFNSFINGEKSQYKKNPSFVIYNVTPQPDRIFYTDKYIYIPKDYNEIEVIDYNQNQPLFIPQEEAKVKFENLDIINSNFIVFSHKNLRGEISFENCKFRNILQQVLNTAYDSNLNRLYINQCEFIDCAFIELNPLIKIIAPNCNGKITNNLFNHYKDGFCFYKNVMQYIYIRNCKDIEISDNIFINNPRGAFFLWSGKIDIVSNEFYNDSTFNSFPDRNFSRDAGAIYCGKLYGNNIITDDNPNKISLRLNKIHDFYGKGDVRGIFIDDGRGDVTCFGNLIFNGQLYSIDSRVDSSDPYSSIRNKYTYNIVAYPYRLTYGDSIRSIDRPILKNNILLFSNGDNKVTTQSHTDIRVSDFKIDGSDVKINNKVLKKLPKEVRNMISPLK